MNKGGQITVFIILGIILVILAGVLIAINRATSEIVDTDEDLSFTYEESMVKEHVEYCLGKIAEDGVKKLGDHAGYIEPLKHGFIGIEQFPTSSSAVVFAPGSDYMIPYWFYMAGKNTCTDDCFFKYRKPPIERAKGPSSVEQQLIEYINENLHNCLDFNQFEQFEVSVDGELETDVFVGDAKILVSADYPLKIVKGKSATQTVSSYQTSVDLNLRKIFTLAEGILNDVVKTGFFERATVEFITVNSFDETIPPISGDVSMDFKISSRWTVQEVKETMKEVLTDQVPAFQILGAKNSLIYNYPNPLLKSFYMNMVAGVSTPSEYLNTTSVEFLYLPWWDIYLDVNPKRGGLITEDPLSLDLWVLQVHILRNQFKYDVSYPIVVVLTDDKALDGQGYKFKFAFEVNVRGNEPFDLSDITLAEPNETGEYSGPPLIQNPDNWNSGEITIITKNIHDNSPVEGVVITLKCGDEAIILGESEILDSGEAGIITKLPVCIGGILSGFKPDYIIKPTDIDTFLDVSGTYIVSSESKKKVKVEFKERMVSKVLIADYTDMLQYLDVKLVHPSPDDYIYWVFKNQSERDIGFDQNVLTVFTKITELGEEEYVTTATFNGNMSNETAELELIVGNYTIETYLFTSGVVIPEEEHDDYTIPKMEFNDSFLNGGVNFNNVTFVPINTTVNESMGNLEITHKNLTDGNLRLYVLSFEPEDFGYAKDMEMVEKQDLYTVNFRKFFEPEFYASEE